MAKSLWQKKPTLDQLNAINRNTVHEPLGIVFTEVGEDYLEATMPVDPRTRQPMGLLHGGASALLAESLGSVASAVIAGFDKSCVGVDLHATHLASMKEGFVVGRTTALKLGRKMHFWRIEIRDGSNPERLVCEVRLSVLISERP